MVMTQTLLNYTYRYAFMRDQCILDNVLNTFKKRGKKIIEKYLLIVVGKLQARFQMHDIH